MASWNGGATTSYATKKQLVSSISGLYDDLQDFSFSTISTVGTLVAKEWISTPVLYVSDIQGATISISGITISQDGVFNAPIVSLSSLNLKGFDLGLDVSFDLGLGKAIGGVAAGLGALVGGGLIAVGTGAGLAIQGAEQGIATMVAGRPQNFISQTNYETINFTTQLQLSTLGDTFPLYSTIFRTVSSSAADQVPGREIFTSSFFTPGTTCIRAVSDPFNLISADSNLNTSTIQSFGQWVPFVDPTVSNEDIFARNATFSSLTIQNSNLLAPPILAANISGTDGSIFMVNLNSYINPVTAEFANPPNPYDIAQSCSNNSIVQFSEFGFDLTFISTPYTQYTSTIGTYNQPVYFIRSTITDPLTTIPLFIYTGSEFGGADFAVCESNETNFLSTATMDFVAQSSNILLQWGLAVDNLNSTIEVGTAKRVSWDIPNGYSNFIDIPLVPSSIVTGTRANAYGIQSRPQEIIFQAQDAGPFGPTIGQPIGLALNVGSATFGDQTTFCNVPNYPYQFNSSLFVKGTIEADVIIATSTIIAVSTFSQTLFSTNVIEAASGLFTSTQTTKGYTRTAFLSTIKASDNFLNDYVNVQSRMLLKGYPQALGIVTGAPTGNLFDNNYRMEFVTDNSPQAIYLQSWPGNKTVAGFLSSGVEINNLAVNNLTASNLIYGKAEAPTIQTSTIEFGWTGNFSFNTPIDYSLQQSLVTEPGLFYANYNAASNQVLNIMAFSNTVNMLAQPFSTPLVYTNTQFDSTDRQGWASTIYYNAQTTPCRVYLAPNAGVGELSLQSQTFGILAILNKAQEEQGIGCNVSVPVGSTYVFTSDGAQWTTSCNAPNFGYIQYNNTFNMTMDFENVSLSTADTFNITAEQINLNGLVTIPNAQFENLYLDGFVSSATATANTFTAASFATTVNNSSSQPFQMFNTTTTTDGFINIRQTVTPSRGFNLFNSYNVGEWNNTQFNINTTTSAGRPTMIVGEVLVTSPPFTPYAGQFWINNAITSPALVIPIYQNNEGVLTQIGAVAGNTYARVFTTNGTSWSIQSNVGNPQGTVTATYSNFYTVAMNSQVTTINTGMPLVYNSPSIVYNNNKTFFYSPQIRVATMDAPSFNTREAAMEAPFYYDSNVIFSRVQATEWESAAFNPVLGIYGNTFYSIAGYLCYGTMTRFRGNGDTLVLAWDIDVTAYPVGGGATDFVWGSARYIQVRAQGNPEGNIRESYLLFPRNYFNFAWQGQGPLN